MAQDDCRGLDFTHWLSIVDGQPLPKGTDMNIDDAFPSKFIKASDLQGRTISVAIREVTIEKMGEDTKAVLWFQGKEKGLTLNVTKKEIIKASLGAETANWRGASIWMRPGKTFFQGAMKDCIDIGVVEQVQPAQVASQPPPQEWRQNAPVAQAPLRTGSPSLVAEPAWPGEPPKDDGLDFDDQLVSF